MQYMSRKINTLYCKLNLIIRNSSFQSLKVLLKTNDQIFIPFLLSTLPTTDKTCIYLPYNILFFFFSIFELPWWLRCKGVCLQCGRPGFNSFLNFILTFFFKLYINTYIWNLEKWHR